MHPVPEDAANDVTAIWALEVFIRLLAALRCATVLLVLCSLPSVRGLAQARPLRDLLPGFPEGGSTVVVTKDGERTLSEHAALFFDPVEAASLLADWGWQANAFRVYEDTPAVDSGSQRPYLQVSLTQFNDSTGAAAALPYLVQNLRPADAHREISMPAVIGDESHQAVAQVEGGVDLTLVARSGPLLIGISALVTEGGPSFDVMQVAEGIIQRAKAPPAPANATTPQPDLAPLLDAVPPELPACLRPSAHERIVFATMSQRFPGVPGAPAHLAELGWQTAVHRQFRCDPIPDSGLNWLDMSVHLFRDPAGAAEAVPFFADARTVGTQLAPVPAMALGDSTAAIAGPSEHGTEYTLYLSTGPLLFRVSAVGAAGAPQEDVEYIMTALFVNATTNEATRALTTRGQGDGAEPTAPPPSSSPVDSGVPYISLDPETGRIIATYPDGTWEYVEGAPVAQVTVTPTPTPLPAQESCDPSYPDVCIPPVAEVGDLDCQDVPYGSFRVLPPDPHRLDGPYDGSNPYEPDGIGCEWN